MGIKTGDQFKNNQGNLVEVAEKKLDRCLVRIVEDKNGNEHYGVTEYSYEELENMERA